MTSADLRNMVDQASPAVWRSVIKRAIDTKTGIVVLGKNGKPKKISYKRLIAK